MSSTTTWKMQSKLRYRMWKSGKQWLFGATVIAASFLSGQMQTLAEEAGSPVEMSAASIGAETLTVVTNPAAHSSSETGSADQIEEGNRPVVIHYKPKADEGENFYVWSWETGYTHQDNHFTPMTKGDDGQWKAEITTTSDKTNVNYIITKENDWNRYGNNNGDAIKITKENRSAPVNTRAKTEVYHGWFKEENQDKQFYSHNLNVQSVEFDQEYGYTDKELDPSSETGFKVVGSAGALGATLKEDGTAKINLWAPTAKSVKLNLYRTTEKLTEDKVVVDMVRGTTRNRENHKNNTVGLWSFEINASVLQQLGKTSADGLAYDYELTIPNSYFIQKTAKHKQLQDGRYAVDYYTYWNSATKEHLKNGQKASEEEIMKFYLGSDAGQVDRTVKTQDPYSVAVVQDGSRSVILNPSKVGRKVEGSQNTRAHSKTAMSVLEMDVRDFSIDESSKVSPANRGNYLGVIEKTSTEGSKEVTGLDYLKYLGVNYVQIMPVYDFQTVPELDKEDSQNNVISQKEADGVHENQQNWGYDPKNYNVPEGSYATDPKDPTNRIKELKEMVQGLHDAGINVIMDVVYNHLYDSQENPFEWTVPGYVYAIQGDSSMNNDVGVGNAVRSNSEMMRQYIRHSIIHWIKEYGMDGFRFDAMSVLDTKTLNLIREDINQIDPKIVTFGEGWDSMGKHLKGEGEEIASSISNAKKIPEYGFFDSVGRDAIAGSAYGEHPNAPGFVNQQNGKRGTSHHLTHLDDVSKSLLGGLDRNYGTASQQLNYIEVHDGMTLSDLLKQYNNDTEADHINRVQLATAMSALSQGIHFSQHGQEFLRSKTDSNNHAHHNTYNGGDVLNRIDWGLPKRFADVVNFTKSLIALKKNEPLLQLSDYEEIKQKMVITNAQSGSGIVTYELRPNGRTDDGRYLMVFNNSIYGGDTLTLGGDSSWYYGHKNNFNEHKNTEGNRGVINETNDFSGAFIVTTNSKNLYDKIGKINGEKTITFDKLTATVLYIPSSKILSKEDFTQTIRYVDKTGQSLAADNVQSVTKVVVEQTDVEKKFGYTTSAIETTSEQTLGHKANILGQVMPDYPKKTTTYYALKMDRTPTTYTGEVTLDATGKPIASSGMQWAAETEFGFDVVVHPDIPRYIVVPSTDSSYEHDSVSGAEIATRTITVTYEKQSTARLYATNDPSNRLPATVEQVEAPYKQEAAEGQTIQFGVSEEELTRSGYTYTVNGQSSLQAAIQARNAGLHTGEDSEFAVTYQPAAAKVVVRYVDTDAADAVVKTEEVTGVTAQAVSFIPSVPEGYLLQHTTEVPTLFDDQDDSGSASQTITVRLQKKIKESQVTRTYTISYQGTEEQVVDVTAQATWTMRHNRETNQTTYIPTAEQTFLTPVKEGYRPDKKAVSILVVETTTEPQNQTLVVTYTRVEKPRADVETRVSYRVAGEEMASLPSDQTVVLDRVEVVEEGRPAEYSWNPSTDSWELTNPSLAREERHHYHLIIPALPLNRTAKVTIPAMKIQDNATRVEENKEPEQPVPLAPESTPSTPDTMVPTPGEEVVVPESRVPSVFPTEDGLHDGVVPEIYVPSVSPTEEDLPDGVVPEIHVPSVSPTEEDLPDGVVPATRIPSVSPTVDDLPDGVVPATRVPSVYPTTDDLPIGVVPATRIPSVSPTVDDLPAGVVPATCVPSVSPTTEDAPVFSPLLSSEPKEVEGGARTNGHRELRLPETGESIGLLGLWGVGLGLLLLSQKREED